MVGVAGTDVGTYARHDFLNAMKRRSITAFSKLRGYGGQHPTAVRVRDAGSGGALEKVQALGRGLFNAHATATAV